MHNHGDADGLADPATPPCPGVVVGSPDMATVHHCPPGLAALRRSALGGETVHPAGCRLEESSARVNSVIETCDISLGNVYFPRPQVSWPSASGSEDVPCHEPDGLRPHSCRHGQTSSGEHCGSYARDDDMQGVRPGVCGTPSNFTRDLGVPATT